MNDPGLDEPISKNAEYAANERPGSGVQDEKDGVEEEDAYMTPR